MIKNNKKYSHTNIKKLSINSLLKKAGVVSAYDRHQISELVKTTLGKELDYDLLFDRVNLNKSNNTQKIIGKK